MSDKVQIYRNGALVSEQSCHYPATAVIEQPDYIGKPHYYETDNGKFFSGVFDDIRVYDKILTEEDIKTVYDEYAGAISAAAAYKDYAALNVAAEFTDGEQLAVKGENGSDITWQATDEGVIDSSGKVKAPPAGGADKRVTLTAKIRNGDAEYTKSFKATILAAPSITGLSDYNMNSVTMSDSYLVNGRDKMYDYLKAFDIDKCVSGFRRTAGLSSESCTYGGWETSLIAGHAIGHYTTALAQGYNDTGDEEILAKSRELIDKLYEAQIKADTTVNGQPVKKGYLFATTNAWSKGKVVSGEGQFDNVEANRTNIKKQAWVPWYTMHKILAGLVDTYKLTGNEKALDMADALGTWTYNRVGGYSVSMQNCVLNIEYGGMNDVLYELYKITKDPNHAKAAHMFDEVSLFDEIYKGNDILANKHANTTIPKILGALNRVRAIDAVPALATDAPDSARGREYYLAVAEKFWDIVVNDHSYVTGGNSENEHFRAPHTENAFRNEINCETCNTYNMLKLSRELYKLTGSKKYEDYYEGTFLNAIVSSQNPETGMTMYFQPMATGYYKVFSTRWNDFWCCTGSGMESFTKLTDSIYYKGSEKIAVNQYISSVLTDAENNIKLTQVSSLPDGETSVLTVEPLTGTEQKASVILRVPEWCASAPVIKLNNTAYTYTQSAGYVTITRAWSAGDKIEITMPMEMRAYGLNDSSTAAAFKYGPTVLSVGLGTSPALTGTPHGMAVRKPAARADINEYVIIDSGYGTRGDWLANLNENMVKTDGKLEFTMRNTDRKLVFTPHYKRYDERYGIYWYITCMTEEEQEEQVLADKQTGRDENIIIDSIELSHDQQENGHGYTQSNSTGVEGTSSMPNYRLIESGGYVDYQMAVRKGAKNYLSVTYHSSDSGNQMSIYAGDTRIANVTAGGRDETVKYEIPESVIAAAAASAADTIKGKDAIHIIFRADAGQDAPKICGKVQILTDYGTNASLLSLSFDEGALSPAFSSAAAEYTLTVPAQTDKLKISAAPADKYGLVYVNDRLINDAAAKEIAVTEAPLVIKVYAEDHETSKTYTISFDKQ